MSATSIYGVDLPDYVKQFCGDFGGLRIEPLTFTQLLDLCKLGEIKHLLIYEKFVLDHEQILVNLVEQGRVGSLTIYIHHPFSLTHGCMMRLDSLAKTHTVNIIVDGYYDKKYENMNIYCHDTWENCISHHFTLLLSQILKKKRNPSWVFALQTVFKDDFRRNVGDFIRNSSIAKNVLQSPPMTSGGLGNLSADFIKKLEGEYGPGQHIHALDAFGNGLPNFKTYESAFCEIVLETRNSGCWHFTEKTYRPIAMGIPIVHLGHGTMYNTLLEYGYRFYDYNFYETWHSDMPLENKLPSLENFLSHIRDSVSAQKQMEEFAEHNYKHFWNERKLHYYKHIDNIFENIFGENRSINKIYDQLNF